MRQTKILWVDDEIDLLKVQIIFLEEKGYQVATANNGTDAIARVQSDFFDIVFLDENMPGISGLEVLDQLKQLRPNMPVVMVTKSEEEDIMDQAIGGKINDYLIKPVKPKQLLLSIKKNVDTKRLVSEKTTTDYQVEFSKLGMKINEARTFDEWKSVYRELVYWEMELERSEVNEMDQILAMQKSEANAAFSKYVQQNYVSWFQNDPNDKPLLSPSLFRNKVVPLLEQGEQVVLLVIDNLRYDQWQVLKPHFAEWFTVQEDDLYCSILPTATHFSRNALFAGLMPSEIQRLHPKLWVNEGEEEGKNLHEAELLQKQLDRLGLSVKFHYSKVNNTRAGELVLDQLNNYLQNQLVVLVYNFVDMLSHARTEMDMIRELANDEPAYRSLTESWFQHSTLKQVLVELSGKNRKLVVTTDHGAIQVNNPIKVVGDRATTTNLRYKQGKNLNYRSREVFALPKPKEAYLPANNLSSRYIFAYGSDFMAYPNNYNHYVKYYKNTFQHGGISLEEMLIPVISLSS